MAANHLKELPLGFLELPKDMGTGLCGLLLGLGAKLFPTPSDGARMGRLGGRWAGTVGFVVS